MHRTSAQQHEAQHARRVHACMHGAHISSSLSDIWSSGMDGISSSWAAASPSPSMARCWSSARSASFSFAILSISSTRRSRGRLENWSVTIMLAWFRKELRGGGPARVMPGDLPLRSPAVLPS